MHGQSSAPMACIITRPPPHPPSARLPCVRGFVWPNGMAFSPDFSKFYLGISSLETPALYVYDVSGDGDLTNRRLFFDAQPMKEVTLHVLVFRCTLAPTTHVGSLVVPVGLWWSSRTSRWDKRACMFLPSKPCFPLSPPSHGVAAQRRSRE